MDGLHEPPSPVQRSWLQSAHTVRAPSRAMLLALDPVRGRRGCAESRYDGVGCPMLGCPRSSGLVMYCLFVDLAAGLEHDDRSNLRGYSCFENRLVPLYSQAVNLVPGWLIFTGPQQELLQNLDYKPDFCVTMYD